MSREVTAIDVYKEGDGFVAVPWPIMPGSPIIGRGKTALEAVGCLFWNDPSLGVKFTEGTIAGMPKWHPERCWSTARDGS